MPNIHLFEDDAIRHAEEWTRENPGRSLTVFFSVPSQAFSSILTDVFNGSPIASHPNVQPIADVTNGGAIFRR
jgi:hypothetical protein